MARSPLDSFFLKMGNSLSAILLSDFPSSILTTLRKKSVKKSWSFVAGNKSQFDMFAYLCRLDFRLDAFIRSLKISKTRQGRLI